MLWFLFTVKEPSTAFEKVNDTRSFHCSDIGNTFTSSPSLYEEFHSENSLFINDPEPEMISEDLPSYDICAVNPKFPSMSILNLLNMHMLITAMLHGIDATCIAKLFKRFPRAWL